MKKIVQTEKAPAAIGPYNQAVIAGNLIYTAGQIPLDPRSGELINDTIEAASERVLQNLQAVIEAAGSDLQHVIKTTVFMTDLGEFAAMNAIYTTYFPDNPPARSAVQVAALPKGARIEIEAVAQIKE